jgi:hypothetical protein
LIKSAKERKLIEEISTYTQAYVLFVTNKNRIPGDIRNEGKIATQAGCVFTDDDFPLPYKSIDTTGHGRPCNFTTGPWIDMYLAGLINFEPKNVNNTSLPHYQLYTVGAIPSSKFDKDMSPYFYYYEQNTCSSGEWCQNFINISAIIFNNKTNNFFYNPLPFKNIDLKIDDGLAKEGKVRGYCKNGATGGSNKEYQESIASSGKCAWISVVMPY